MRKSLALLVILAIFPSVVFSSAKLIFAIDLIRHGDRTPIEAIPTVKYHWKQGLGQLTAEGMRQEFEMGQRFRHKYIDETHLLPTTYQRDTIMVRSTDYDRTLMSAQSLLMGLYPAGTGPSTDDNQPGLPNALQPIPIHTAPLQYDDVIIKRVDPEERQRLMQKYVYSTPEWRNKESELRPKFPLWSKLSGMEISELEDLGRLSDSLYIHQIHHVPMPDGMSSEDVDTIIAAGSFAYMQEERPKQLAVAYNSQLMTNIANYLDRATQRNAKVKYILLSAHDSTIAGTLSFLGAPLTTPPPYASDLNFSLYESGANVYTVKVTYNGQPVDIPACSGSVCELTTFINYIKKTGN